MERDRSVLYFVATSLDGFVARDDGSVDWLFDPGAFDFETFLARIDTVLMGRATYDQVRGFGEWPYAGKKAYVFSRARAGETDEYVRFLATRPV